MLSFFFLYFLMFYFWERERQSASRGEAEREGDTESKAGSRLWAVSTEPDVGLEPTDHKIMTWAEARRLTDWATQAPQYALILKGMWELRLTEKSKFPSPGLYTFRGEYCDDE